MRMKDENKGFPAKIHIPLNKIVVAVSLLLTAVECSPLDYELSYTEQHHNETNPKKPTGYARCYCEKETPLQNYTSGYIYKTSHNKRICSEVLTPTICSFFEGCNYCIGTIEKCEPVQGGYQCVSATVLFQQLNRNTTSVNNTIMFETYYNFDAEKNMNVPSVKRFMEKESELKMSKSPEIEIHQETNKKIQKELAPILQRNFQKETEVLKLKMYRNKENRLSLEMYNETRENTPKINQPSASVYKDKNEEVPMGNSVDVDNPNNGEVFKPGKRSKRSALEDGVKDFEGAAEEIFEQKESFEENQEGAANFVEETEDPLNKIHEVHCTYPTTGRTFATEVIRFQTYDLITQKCNYGYAFQEGIARSMRCDHDKNELEPKYDIWTEECKPFLNCSVEFLRGGYAKCRSGLWFKPPTCEVRCELYLDGDNIVDYHTCDVHKGWIPDLPSCAIPGSHVGLIPAPILMLHELY